uniref:Cytohesin 4 n=1 Tax=Corvus moneduloides TaxID=1196302 RepID=A0A8U7MYK6_CORMO
MDLCPAESTDLSGAEEAEIETIRKHKQELLDDIKRLKEEIAEVFAEIECFQHAEERQETEDNPGEQTSKLSQRDKILSLGRKKFNMDPEKGIQYLIEHQVLSSDLQEIARFLHKGEGLNKTAIGDYLGGRDPTNIQILQAFVACHQFANLNLVQALRQFLWSFRLPGEAQKIDRMMEAFANWYCKCNPGVFQSTDTCYVLSFSIIMLNTSLHNPNVKDKPHFERFVSINRGIDNGGDLPEELLKNLFESIKNEPFSIPEDDGNDLTHTFFNPNREGWLLKLGEGEDSPSSSDLPVCLPPTTNLPRAPTVISSVLRSCLLPWAEADTCCWNWLPAPSSQLLQALSAQKGTQKHIPPHSQPHPSKFGSVCVSIIRHHLSGVSLGLTYRESGEGVTRCAWLAGRTEKCVTNGF